MVKVGDKFIIEVVGESSDCYKKLFVIKDSNSYWTEESFVALERYNETEAYNKGYAKAMQEAQKAVRTLLAMDYKDKDLYFGGSHATIQILSEFDVREITEKLQLYEEEKSKIRVGDEVEIVGLGSKAVVTSVYEYERCVFVLYYDGSTDEFTDRTKLKKTGRHFDEVEKLIEILKGGDSDEIPF